MKTIKCWLIDRVFSAEAKMIENLQNELIVERAKVKIPPLVVSPIRQRVDELMVKNKEDVRNGLAVKDDHPVLRSVLTLMDAKQQAHIESAGCIGICADEAKAEARCVTALQEMQEIILEEAERGRAEER